MGMGTSGRFVVRVAFERVELDTVQLLEALPAAIAREVVLHLGCVLLHVPIERSTLPTLVPAYLALQGRLPSVRAPVHLQMVLPLERLAAGLTGELADACRWQRPQDPAQ